MFYKYRNDANGNMSVVFAVSILMILTCIGVTVDMISTFSAKSKMQNALDGAVLAAALNADKSDYYLYGTKSYTQNLSVNRLELKPATFSKGSGKMVGTAEGRLPTYFAGILPKSALNIRIKSTANISEKQSSPCIIALSTTARPGITVNGGTIIDAEGCEMHTHSNTERALTANAGIDIKLDKTCVKGSGVTDNSNGGIGLLQKNCTVAPDPYAGVIPEPDATNCDFRNGNYNSVRPRLRPGVYCGWHNFNNSNAKVEFEPGLYILRNGGWNVNGGEWNGDDVTFYFYDNSKIQFNSGVKADMSAPTSGDYKNIFMAEKSGLPTRDFILNDNKGFDFSGVIYLPSKRIKLHGASTLVARRMKLIGDTISFNSSYLSIEVEDDNTAGTVISPYLSE